MANKINKALGMNTVQNEFNLFCLFLLLGIDLCPKSCICYSKLWNFFIICEVKHVKIIFYQASRTVFMCLFIYFFVEIVQEQ